MKKVLTIIFCLVCALTASAVSYATPYMGSGRGFIHTTSSARVHSIDNGGGGMASAPVATMSSVNSHRSTSSSTVASISCASGIASTPRVHSGIYTSASAISGGVTTCDEDHHHGNVRKVGGHHGDADECPGCIDEDGDGDCDLCGDPMDDCGCGEHCHCPLDEEWHVWLFVSLIVAIYALIKVKRERLAVKRETI